MKMLPCEISNLLTHRKLKSTTLAADFPNMYSALTLMQKILNICMVLLAADLLTFQIRLNQKQIFEPYRVLFGTDLLTLSFTQQNLDIGMVLLAADLLT